MSEMRPFPPFERLRRLPRSGQREGLTRQLLHWDALIPERLTDPGSAASRTQPA